MARGGFFTRVTATSRDVIAGCFVCHGTDAHWFGGSAQGTAARHHDATNHPTWCDVAMSVRYGVEPRDDRQIDIEDAISRAPIHCGSGDRPDAIPLPEHEPDASMAATIAVSAPPGRPIETRSRPNAGAQS